MSPDVIEQRSADPVVEVTGLCVDYHDPLGRIRVLRDVSIAIWPRETLALVGESGSGKSTLARAIVRLLPRTGVITAGSVSVEGREVTGMSERDLQSVRGSRVGFVFQDPDVYLNPVFSIGRQVSDVILQHKPVEREQAWQAAEQQLARVDIRNPALVMKAFPHQLSGGMRQRVMMAIATCCAPALLIADEPTTALDVLVQRQVLGTLAHLKRDVGMAVLLVTHDLGLVAENADRVAVMYGGTIVEVQSAEKIFVEPRHPYTAGLIAASRPAGRRFATLSGSPPDLRKLGTGCPFAPRCERAVARCAGEMPPLETRPEGGGAFACWNPIP
jgi:oligopeptide/dipeptide ABC transporter ATP-binding protein